MYGVTFGNKHSFNDFGMVMTGYSIGNPEVERYLAKVPGRNGAVDMTGALTPYIVYGNRQLQFAFVWRSSPDSYEDEKQAIVNALHGRKLQVILDSDPDYYYDGFVTVEPGDLSGKEKATITVNVDAAPYKLKNTETTKTKSGSGTLVCENDRMEVIPQITATAATSITFNGSTYSLSAGTYTLPGIVFSQGNNELTISGSGTTTIKYRQGRL